MLCMDLSLMLVNRRIMCNVLMFFLMPTGIGAFIYYYWQTAKSTGNNSSLNAEAWEVCRSRDKVLPPFIYKSKEHWINVFNLLTVAKLFIKLLQY